MSNSTLRTQTLASTPLSLINIACYKYSGIEPTINRIAFLINPLDFYCTVFLNHYNSISSVVDTILLVIGAQYTVQHASLLLIGILLTMCCKYTP